MEQLTMEQISRMLFDETKSIYWIDEPVFKSFTFEQLRLEWLKRNLNKMNLGE